MSRDPTREPPEPDERPQPDEEGPGLPDGVELPDGGDDGAECPTCGYSGPPTPDGGCPECEGGEPGVMIVEDDETRDAIIDALAAPGLLTAKQARVYVLRYVERRTRHYTADVLGVSVSVVDDHAGAARRKLDAARETLRRVATVAGNDDLALPLDAFEVDLADVDADSQDVDARDVDPDQDAE